MNKERGRGFRLVIEGKDFFLPLSLFLSASLCISFSLLFAFSTSTFSSSFFAFQIPARQATHIPSLLIMSALTNPTPPPPPVLPQVCRGVARAVLALRSLQRLPQDVQAGDLHAHRRLAFLAVPCGGLHLFPGRRHPRRPPPRPHHLLPSLPDGGPEGGQLRSQGEFRRSFLPMASYGLDLFRIFFWK